eukprot:g10308.t1
MDRWDSGDLPANWPGARWEQSWKVPRVLVFNCQVPYTAGKIFGSYPDEDGGFSILNYFASALLASNAATPALQLWKRFVEEGVSTKEGISLKVVGRVEDLDKHEVPESFKRFNNKPVLLTRSATVYKKRLPEMLEIDFDVRNWNYPTRAAMVSYHHRAREAEVEIGYLLEGKADDELPEQILGCFTETRLQDSDIRLPGKLLRNGREHWRMSPNNDMVEPAHVQAAQAANALAQQAAEAQIRSMTGPQASHSCGMLWEVAHGKSKLRDVVRSAVVLGRADRPPPGSRCKLAGWPEARRQRMEALLVQLPANPAEEPALSTRDWVTRHY